MSGITPRILRGPRASRRPGLDKSDDDSNDDNMPDLETEEKAGKKNILNKINNFDEMVRNKEDEFDKMF